MSTREVNFDGLVGPTHNYAGLALGNVASIASRSSPSDPRRAALQGLDKMQRFLDLGLAQAVLPPHERPDVRALRAFGFTGSDAAVLARAAREAPELLAACASASPMWTANAATVAPSADTADGRVHVTTANLVAKLHRALEAPTTDRVLRAIFPARSRFAVHPPLPGGAAMGDEGAANHTRLCADHGSAGLHVFVHGQVALDADAPRPVRYPARHSREASAAVVRLHGLAGERVVHVAQAPEAIDAGVFHNDVICVGNEDTLLYHEQAFVETPVVVETIARRFEELCSRALIALPVRSSEVRLADAVSTYLFNSQIVTLAPGRMAIVAPAECREHSGVRALLDSLVADGGNPIVEAHYPDVRESMRNGGGPACLRQRIVLTEEERAAAAPGVFLDDGRLESLRAWVERHYRDRLVFHDLADPSLLDESRRALDELTVVLGLGSVYEFQREPTGAS